MTNNLKLDEPWDSVIHHMWLERIIPDYITTIGVGGRSRSGKSTCIERLMNPEVVTLHEAMPIEDLIGGLMLIDGRTQWVDGPATKALRHGRPLLINEVNFQPPECLSMLYCLLDKPAAITLPTGERVKAAKGYCVIATQNPPFDQMPFPIFDRIDCFLKADDLSQGIKDYLGPHLAEKAQAALEQTQPRMKWSRPMTVNAILAYKALHDAGVTDQDAAVMLGFQGAKEIGDFVLTMNTKRSR